MISLINRWTRLNIPANIVLTPLDFNKLTATHGMQLNMAAIPTNSYSTSQPQAYKFAQHNPDHGHRTIVALRFGQNLRITYKQKHKHLPQKWICMMLFWYSTAPQCSISLIRLHLNESVLPKERHCSERTVKLLNVRSDVGETSVQPKSRRRE